MNQQMRFSVLTLVILICLGLGWFIGSKNRNIIIKSDTITIYNHDTTTVWKTKLVPYKVVEYVTLSKIDSVYLFMNDSAECIQKLVSLFKQYNQISYSNDTLKNDSVAFISVLSKVTRNKTDSIGIVYVNNTPTKVVINKIDKNGLFLGAVLGSKITSPMVNYVWEDYNAGIGYDIQSKSINFYLGYRIKSW